MTAVMALDKQIERYRRIAGEQRLTVTLELHELSCDIARVAQVTKKLADLAQG